MMCKAPSLAGSLAMNLVQILLPAYDNKGGPFPRRLHDDVRRHLTDRFGGLTAYTRAPAKGAWKQGHKTVRDDILVLEVMTLRLQRRWWRSYRRELERRFKQNTIVVRSQRVTIL
jgi:hypothetical protein